jgi:hypothetical protein
MLCLLERLPCIKDLSGEIIALKIKAESCSRQLKAWTQSLQNPISKASDMLQKS